MTEENQLPPQENPDDKLSTGLAILSFYVPIAGAIIYFSNKGHYTEQKRNPCHAALWGVGIGIVLNIIGRLAGAS